MPELPCSGDSWEPMANSLEAEEAQPGMYPEAVGRECFSNLFTDMTLSAASGTTRRESRNSLGTVSKTFEFI